MASTTVDEYLITSLYEKLEAVVGDREVSIASVVSIAALAMMVVERQQGLSGEEKKILVITLLHRLAENSDMMAEDKAALHLVIDSTVPDAIDSLVDATKGGLDINKTKSRWAWIRKNCCCCCARS